MAEAETPPVVSEAAPPSVEALATEPPAEDAPVKAPESIPAPPELPPTADANQLMRDIFGESDEDEEEAQMPADEADDADEDRNKAANRLEGVKKAKRQRSEEKSKRSRKTEKDKDSKKKKRAEAAQADIPAAAGGASDEEKYTGIVKQAREQSDFDKVVDSLKRGHRKKRDDAADDVSRAYVKDLLTRMQNAAQSDLDAIRSEQPATYKLKLLPEAIAAVGKAYVQPFCVPDILPVITTWLTPTSDGSLPNLSVREGMLNILKQLQNIDTESLKQSGVGRAVMALFKHPNEQPKNKKMAQELIERWSRPLFQLTDSYKDLRDAGEDGEMGAPRRRLLTTSIERTSPLDKYVQAKKNVKPRVRAQIPNRDPLDFTKQPRSFRDSAGDVELPAMPPSLQFKVSKTKFAEKLNSKGGNKSPHFVKMSVEGRGFGQ